MSRPPHVSLRVCLDVEGQTLEVGTGYVSERRGTVSTTFTYNEEYQGRRLAYAVSPDMPLSSARHHLTRLPGAFTDSAPDRWGRNLIRKRLLAQAREEGRSTPSVGELDYLLGVGDSTRQGALRFSRDSDGPFLARADSIAGVPKLIELPRLLAAADVVAEDGGDDWEAVKVLLDAGTGTLGGSRPKASVRDGDRLLIAKFPHHADRWDVMAWEKTALDLAQIAGITTPERRLVEVDGRHVLLLERFDRGLEAARAGYISAMTLLQGTDGPSFDYLELVEALSAHGSAVRRDTSQLWRRIAFSLMLNNTDDHMRNHGFLHEDGGWRLAPVFDVNPDPDPSKTRASTVGFASEAHACRARLFESAADFSLSQKQAQNIFDDVLETTKTWRDVAMSNGVPERELKEFAAALDRFR